MNPKILASLVKIIKKDPVVAVQDDDQHYSVFHLSGKSTLIEKTKIEVPPDNAEPIYERIDNIQSALKTRIEEVEKSIPAQVEYDGVTADEVESMLAEVVKKFDYSQAIIESAETTKEELKKYLNDLIESIELPEKTVVEQHHHHTVETKSEVDLADLQKLVKKKVRAAMSMDKKQPSLWCKNLKKA